MRYADTKGPGNSLAEGDHAFNSMNLKADRTALQPGEVYEAINKRLARGVAETRPGTITPVWANIVPFDSILGSEVYNNPNGEEVILIATPSAVVSIRCGAYPTTIPIPAGVTLAVNDNTPFGQIQFSQDFDKVFLEGAMCGTLQWDGVSPAGFVPITNDQPDNAAVTLTPTDVPWSVNMGGRRIFPLSSPASPGPLDSLGVSEILDYTVYDPILAVFRVNAGTADPVIGAYPYMQNNLIVGKRRSIDILTNFAGDLSTAAMQIMSVQLGIVAQRSVAMLGADLMFLSDTGIYRISQVVQNLVQAQPVPVSDRIEPLIKRINMAAASQAVAAVYGFYYYLAVPLDGSPVNNTVLAYNTVTDAWESYDQWNPAGNMQIDNLLVSNYQSSRRLYAINHAEKAVHVLYEGMEDELPNGIYPVSDLLRSRAYQSLPTLTSRFPSSGVEEFGSTAFMAPQKDFKQVVVGLRTWNPSITVTAICEGADNGRVMTATPITKDPTQYYLFGRPDYDLTNVNDDFQMPGRQDYSVVPPDAGVNPGSGIVPDQKQQRPELFSIKARSRWMAIDIANTQGQCDVLGILTEASGVRDQRRRAA